MIPWILLIGSVLAFLVLFFRRMHLTKKDLLFQEHLAEEEAQSQAPEPVESAREESELEADPEVPQWGARKLFHKADLHFSRNEWDDAEALFLAILAMEPEHLDAHHKLGLMHMKKGDFPQAELYFSKLVNLKQDPVYFSNLGAALYQQQRLIEAAEAYENALALDDRRAERLQSLGQVYYELGEEEKALNYFERAAKRKPKDLELKWILADFYERMDRLEEAADLLKAILQADPYNEEVKARLKNLQSVKHGR